MITGAMTERPGGLPLRVGSKSTEMRIPRLEAEEQRLFVEEQLLSRVDRDLDGAWVIDLSEHAGGATLALAGMLVSFREKAWRRDCDVKFTGLMNGCG